jgi:hypothetical protein
MGTASFFFFWMRGGFGIKKRKRYSGQLEIAPKKCYFYAYSNSV